MKKDWLALQIPLEPPFTSNVLRVNPTPLLSSDPITSMARPRAVGVRRAPPSSVDRVTELDVEIPK
jgi:hypothetical protein